MTRANRFLDERAQRSLQLCSLCASCHRSILYLFWPLGFLTFLLFMSTNSNCWLPSPLCSSLSFSISFFLCLPACQRADFLDKLFQFAAMQKWALDIKLIMVKPVKNHPAKPSTHPQTEHLSVAGTNRHPPPTRGSTLNCSFYTRYT